VQQQMTTDETISYRLQNTATFPQRPLHFDLMSTIFSQHVSPQFIRLSTRYLAQSFGALSPFLGQQEGHPAGKKSCSDNSGMEHWPNLE